MEAGGPLVSSAKKRGAYDPECRVPLARYEGIKVRER